jgi:hypothetical protein
MTSPARLRFGTTVAILAMGPSLVHAQSGTGAYVSGGWSVASRDRGNAPTSVADLGPHRSLVHTVLVGAGYRFTPRVGLEGEMQLQAGQSFDWRYSYQFARNSLQTTTDRDTPLVGLLRVRLLPNARVGLEPVIGGGGTFHSAASEITADCGSGQFPQPCVPLPAPVEGDRFTTFEWLFATGVDVPMRVSQHVAIAPSFRILVVKRRQFLTGHAHRGPAVGGGLIGSFGAVLRWGPG